MGNYCEGLVCLASHGHSGPARRSEVPALRVKEELRGFEDQMRTTVSDLRLFQGL